MALTLDSAPTYMKRGSTVEIQVSGSAVTPTIGNTTVVSGSAVLTISNIVAEGGGVYILKCIVPHTVALQHDNVTGYAWTITVSAENVITGDITLLPQPGYDFVNLTNPTTTSSLLTGYTAVTAVTGDQLVYTKRNYPEGLTLDTVNINSTYTLSAAIGIDSKIKRYVIQANGNVAATEVLTDLPTMALVVNDVNANTAEPLLTGTCSRLHSDIGITIDGTDRFNTMNVSKDWAFNTDPFEVSPSTVVASNETGGVSRGSYNFDHNGLVLLNSNVALFYREGLSHVGNDSRIMMKISTDDGVTFGAPTVVIDDPSWDVRGVAVNLASNGNISLFYVTRDNSIGQNDPKDFFHVYSTDNGTTWSTPSSIMSLFPDVGASDWIAAWGTGFQTSQGLMQVVYAVDRAWAIFSSDNGVTWGNRKVIYDYESSTDFLSECTPVKIDDDHIVMYTRRQNNQTIVYVHTSDDGGLTWTNPRDGGATWSSELIQSPPTTRGALVGDDVVIGIGARKPLVNILTMRGSKWHAFYASEELLDENSPARKVVYEGDPTMENIDHGMPNPVALTNKDYTCLIFWYSETIGSDAANETDIFVGTDQRY